MNETSQTTISGGNGRLVTLRAFTRSSTVTAVVRAQPGMELAVADVERDHAGGAVPGAGSP